MNTSKTYSTKSNYLKLGSIFGAGIGLGNGVLTKSIAIVLSLGAGVDLLNYNSQKLITFSLAEGIKLN